MPVNRISEAYLLRQCKAKVEIYQGFRRKIDKERLMQDEIFTINTGDACENFQIFAGDNNHVRIR
jgi:hypothetical protein